MNQFEKRILLTFLLVVICLTAGCIKRELTITSQPPGAVVWLNDEEIGSTPVSVNFKWYGDYKVRLEKSGYEILASNQELKAPFYDSFPLDLFVSLWPGTIEETSAWHFELHPAQLPDSKALLNQAEIFRKQVQHEMEMAETEIQQTLEENQKK